MSILYRPDQTKYAKNPPADGDAVRVVGLAGEVRLMRVCAKLDATEWTIEDDGCIGFPKWDNEEMCWKCELFMAWSSLAPGVVY